MLPFRESSLAITRKLFSQIHLLTLVKKFISLSFPTWSATYVTIGWLVGWFLVHPLFGDSAPRYV
jgi:hypothetical protein